MAAAVVKVKAEYDRLQMEHMVRRTRVESDVDSNDGEQLTSSESSQGTGSETDSQTSSDATSEESVNEGDEKTLRKNSRRSQSDDKPRGRPMARRATFIKKFMETAALNRSNTDQFNKKIKRVSRKRSAMNDDIKDIGENIWFGGSGPENIDQTAVSDGVFYPDSPGRVAWDMLGMLFILYQSIVVPYRLCFDLEAEGSWQVVELIIDVSFMIDIMINFNTGFYSKGQLVLSRKKIAINYLRTWFFLDVLASFPYSWILEPLLGTEEAEDEEESSSGNSAVYKTPQLLRLIKFVRFLRILRLLRVLKLKRILVKFEETFNSQAIQSVLGMFKLFAIILFIGHWTACAWYYVGVEESSDKPYTWISAAGIQDMDNEEKYITSLYWAFTTMTTVGYGDIHPITKAEKIYAMLSMLMACGVFAYTVGSIGTVFNRVDYTQQHYREKMIQLNHYMRYKGLPGDVQFRVRRYLEYVADNKREAKIDNEQDILKYLSEPLREKIYLILNGNLVSTCGAFSYFDENLTLQFSSLLVEEVFAPADIIFEEEDYGNRMYFITKGKVEVFHGPSNSSLKHLSEGSYFGEIAFFTDSGRCSSARCLDFVDTATLDKKKFLQLIHAYPRAKEIYSNIKDNIVTKRDLTALEVECYLCTKLGHVATECETSHIRIDRDELRRRWLFSKTISHKELAFFGELNPRPIKSSDAVVRHRTRGALFQKITDSSDESETEFDDPLLEMSRSPFPHHRTLPKMFSKGSPIRNRNRHLSIDSPTRRNKRKAGTVMVDKLGMHQEFDNKLHQIIRPVDYSDDDLTDEDVVEGPLKNKKARSIFVRLVKRTQSQKTRRKSRDLLRDMAKALESDDELDRSKVSTPTPSPGVKGGFFSFLKGVQASGEDFSLDRSAIKSQDQSMRSDASASRIQKKNKDRHHHHSRGDKKDKSQLEKAEEKFLMNTQFFGSLFGGKKKEKVAHEDASAEERGKSGEEGNTEEGLDSARGLLDTDQASGNDERRRKGSGKPFNLGMTSIKEKDDSSTSPEVINRRSGGPGSGVRHSGSSFGSMTNLIKVETYPTTDDKEGQQHQSGGDTRAAGENDVGEVKAGAAGESTATGGNSAAENTNRRGEARKSLPNRSEKRKISGNAIINGGRLSDYRTHGSKEEHSFIRESSGDERRLDSYLASEEEEAREEAQRAEDADDEDNSLSDNAEEKSETTSGTANGTTTHETKE